MIWLMLVVMGAIFGSFVNALVWRLYLQQNQKHKTKSIKKKTPKELSIVNGRSMCSSCGHSLSTLDLIPIISWLVLKGRCRYCQESIPDTPIPEVVLPIFFVVSYWLWPFSFAGLFGLTNFLLWLVILVIATALFIYDLRWMILPNRLVLAFFLLALIQVLALSFVEGYMTLFASFAGAIVLGGIFYLLNVVSQGRWIGGGDVKLGFGLGLLAGSPLQALLLLFIASFLGSLVALPQIFRQKLSLSSRLPFGPLLILASVITVLVGQDIIHWYHELIFAH